MEKTGGLDMLLFDIKLIYKDLCIQIESKT